MPSRGQALSLAMLQPHPPSVSFLQTFEMSLPAYAPILSKNIS